MTIGEFFESRYVILIIVLIVIAVFLYFLGFFKFVRNVTLQCLNDHTTGFVTINNLARFTLLWAFTFTLICVHFNINITPHFQIITKPLSEVEIISILGFIIGSEAVKKIKNPLQ